MVYCEVLIHDCAVEVVEYVVFQAGLRSWWAVDAMKEHGFTDVINAGSYDRVAAAVERIQAAKWESKGLDMVNNKAVHPAGEL